MQIVVDFARKLGALRLMLAALALIAIAFVPTPGTQIVYTGGIEFLYTVVMPVVAPVVFVVLMLDVLMSRIFMADADTQERARLRLVIWTHLILGAAIMLRFIPFILAVEAF
jgi:hypothetical protein